MARHNVSDPKWSLISSDPLTHRKTWMKIEDGLMHFRWTIPEWLNDAIIEENKLKAKMFAESGGWKSAKFGAVVASVPTIMDHDFKIKSGWTPGGRGLYDQDKYNSFLDDSDYRHLRTGGGRIGKRKKLAAGIQARLKAAASPVPLILGVK